MSLIEKDYLKVLHRMRRLKLSLLEFMQVSGDHRLQHELAASYRELLQDVKDFARCAYNITEKPRKA